MAYTLLLLSHAQFSYRSSRPQRLTVYRYSTDPKIDKFYVIKSICRLKLHYMTLRYDTLNSVMNSHSEHFLELAICPINYNRQCWSESGLVSPVVSPSPQGQSPSPSPSPSGQSPSPSGVSPSPLDQSPSPSPSPLDQSPSPSPSPVGQSPSPSPRVQQKSE